MRTTTKGVVMKTIKKAFSSTKEFVVDHSGIIMFVVGATIATIATVMLFSDDSIPLEMQMPVEIVLTDDTTL
jgi:hypothetical protein